MNPEQIEAACEVMHDAYEAAAIKAGWATQERSRVPWADVPEANKATMRVAVAGLLDHLLPKVVDEWAVDYSEPFLRTWRDGWVKGFQSREEAAAFAAKATDGKVMHRRVTEWTEVDS